MIFDLEELRAAVAAQGAVARVVVTDVRGSAPREVGASMLVWNGGQTGTIGGGRLEWDATALAAQTLADGKARVYRFALGPELGQCCGGAVQVAISLFDAKSLPEPGIVALPLGDGDLPEPPARLPGVRGDWFFEATNARGAPVWIFGAGHVGRAIVDILHKMPGFDITWVDTAPDRFPAEAPVGCLPAPDPTKALAVAPPEAHVLILTYSHELDLALCHAALERSVASIGLIGSHTKWARFRKRLSALGHSEDQINRITCPIGDPALGRHPQAIALGVVAGLLSSAGAPVKKE